MASSQPMESNARLFQDRIATYQFGGGEPGPEENEYIAVISIYSSFLSWDAFGERSPENCPYVYLPINPNAAPHRISVFINRQGDRLCVDFSRSG